MKDISLTTKIYDSRLISTDSNSTVLRYCLKYKINTIEDFLNFYNENGVLTKARAEVLGLVDILNYVFYNTFSNEIIDLLNTKFTLKKTVVNLSIQWDKKDLNTLRRLGLNSEEVRSFIYFVSKYKNKLLIDIVEEFIKPENKRSRGWLGENKNAILLSKMEIIHDIYLFYKKQVDIVQEEKNNIELEKLYLMKEKIYMLQKCLTNIGNLIDKEIEEIENKKLIIENNNSIK